MAAGTNPGKMGEHEPGAFGGHIGISHPIRGWSRAGFVGEIASFRISSVARYGKPFDPPHVLAKDARTTFLLDVEALKESAVSGNIILDMAAPEKKWELKGNATIGAPGG